MRSTMKSLLVFLAIALPVAAHADAGVSVSPFLGGYSFDTAESTRTGLIYGARLGYDFRDESGIDRFSLEGSFGRVSSRTPADTDIDALLFKAEALFPVAPYGGLVPYLAAGGGGMFLSRNNALFDRSPLIDYGLGVKYYLAENFALRGDVRHSIIFNQEATRNNYEYTGGLVMAFGKKKAAASSTSLSASAEKAAPAYPLPEQPRQEAPLASPPAAPAPPVAAPPSAAPAPPAPEQKAAPAVPAPQEPAGKQRPVQPLQPPVPPASPEAAPNVQASQGGGIVIRKVRWVKNAVEVLADRPIRNPKVFKLTAPARLVIDIAGAEAQAPENFLAVNAAGVSSVRIGRYPDKVRVVIDATGGTVPQAKVSETPNGLRITFP
ncbi:MAG TPA: AMIN domain-containing protein [Verrucomicrobiae bacterium]|nr:AMIN domain-containing protein [Verrucomicrobiae bacterium]